LDARGEKLKLEQAIDLFLGDYKASTRQAYAKDLRSMRDWLGPARDVSDITPPMLIEYFQKSVKQKGYAPATIQKASKTLKTFFNWAVRVDLIPKTPAHAIRARKPARRISREKAMNDDELNALLDYLRYKRSWVQIPLPRLPARESLYLSCLC
jgi:site-specific recombinase XerD